MSLDQGQVHIRKKRFYLFQVLNSLYAATGHE